MATAPRLPAFIGGLQHLSGSRITASAINRQAPTPAERTLTVAAHGEVLPIAYGRVNLPGLLFARGAIGGDLVVGYALCVGEIDAVEMVQINDVDASTITGVTVTTYRGLPTQTADATLSSAIAAYVDSMRFDVGNGLRGIAYVVLRITAEAAVGGWPRVRATIRGRKVYDPRTDTTAFSDNSALCMADLITDHDYGLGLTVANLSAAADWCDSLLGDGATKRARLSLVLSRPAPILPTWLDLLSAYAEVFYLHEGAAIKMIPDQAVDLEQVPVVTTWLAESLSVRVEDTSDSPSSVEMIYSVPRSDAAPWGTESVTRAISSDEAATTTVRMPGVVTIAEADTKALARLRRMQNRQTISVMALDDGVGYQPGDVIRLHSSARGVLDLPMRITRIAMQGPGRYQLTGERYDPSFYPSEAPVGPSASLPSGVIVLRPDATTPTDMSVLSAADGRLIIGAGGALAQGASGGAGWNVAFSGTTSADGSHTGSSTYQTPWLGDGDPTTTPITSNPSIPPSAAVHSHPFSANVTVNPRRRKLRLLQADAQLVNVPAGCQMFGLANVQAPGWVRDTAAAGRALQADAEAGNIGAASQNVAVTTGSASDAHQHGAQDPHRRATSSGFGPFPVWSGPVSGGGTHDHSVTLSVVAALKRRRLALYTATGDAPVVPGLIGLWSGGAPPTGWVLCDGANGSPDMRDHFVEISANGSEGTAAGNNTATASGTTNNRSHSHSPQNIQSDRSVASEGRHTDTVSHNHSASDTRPLDPPYYALAFIMHQPGA